MIEPLDYNNLKRRQREIRDGFHVNLALRVHRALSWLQRAEQELDDGDARFLFLWIALNAAYANDIHDRTGFGERRVLINFLNRLIGFDEETLLYRIVWEEFPTSIRLLIDNKFVFQPFWDYHNGRQNNQWEKEFLRSRAAAHQALGRLETKKVLAVVFDRLYVLRNQLIHGGATWNSSVNRNQVRDGAAILDRLVPAIIQLMMDSGGAVWGEPCYPVVDG
ncbi:MAG: HEPN domain-containing protein [Candidatus Sedimenticola sp. (ex Thyasira tokunagai)]